MRASFTVENCPEPVPLPGPDLRKVKHKDFDDEYEYEDDDSLFNTLSYQPKKSQIQVRSSGGQQSSTWEHYIAAEEVTWDYAPHLTPTDR